MWTILSVIILLIGMLILKIVDETKKKIEKGELLGNPIEKGIGFLVRISNSFSVFFMLINVLFVFGVLPILGIKYFNYYGKLPYSSERVEEVVMICIAVIGISYVLFYYFKDRITLFKKKVVSKKEKPKTIGELNEEFRREAKIMGLNVDPETPSALSNGWTATFVKVDKEK